MKTAGLVLLLLLLLAQEGCVERKLEVKSAPPDALVTVDGKQATRAKAGEPAVLKFEHYGIRHVVVRAEGYVAQDRMVTIDPPWWQLLPFDFVTDVLWPGTLEDTRTEEFTLVQRDDLDDPAREEAGRKTLLEHAADAAAEADKHP